MATAKKTTKKTTTNVGADTVETVEAAETTAKKTTAAKKTTTAKRTRTPKAAAQETAAEVADRKSTRLNSSHVT